MSLKKAEELVRISSFDDEYEFFRGLSSSLSAEKSGSGKNLNFAVMKAREKCINLQAFSFFFRQKFLVDFSQFSFVIRLEKWVLVSAKFDVRQHCAAEKYYYILFTQQCQNVEA